MRQYLLILSVIVSSLHAYSQDTFIYNGFFFRSIDENELEITGYDILWEGTYEIPEEVNGKRVTTLGPKSFYGFGRTRTLYIPKSINRLRSENQNNCFSTFRM